jgi:hypothetical protein
LARTQVGNACLAFLVLAFGGADRFLQGRHLPAQLEQLLVEEVDLGLRLIGQGRLVGQLLGKRRDARILFAAHASQPGQAFVVRLERRKVRLQRRQLVHHRLALALLQAQQVGQLGDLPRQAAQHGVFAGRFLADVELRHHEDREQERDDHQQRGQHVHVARPEQVMAATLA